jgi:hypothetical protein
MHLYIYGLFNDAVCSSDYIASDDRTVVNDEWKRMRKEAAVGYFEVLTRSLPEVTKKNHEIPSRNSVSADIRIGVLPNSSQERYCLINFLRYVGL